MDLAMKACHGAWHCKSFSAWSPQDTIVGIIVVLVIAFIVWVRHVS